jgi:predicted DNA-binding ribbon-helix-helix protein
MLSHIEGRWIEILEINIRLRILHLDTIAPLHHNQPMRLSVNLEPDLYAMAKSLAKADDVSLNVLINQKLRDALFGQTQPTQTHLKNGLLVSSSKVRVTRDMVMQALEEDE